MLPKSPFQSALTLSTYLAIPIATITADTQNRAPLLVTIVYCLYIANEMAWNRKKVLITWRRETLLSSKE
jgi:hypothetical protein